MKTKIEFLQQTKNTDIVFKLIKDCRAQHLSSQGKEQRSNFKAGESATSLFNHLAVELAETNTNQFTMPNTVLAEVIGCTTTNLASRMKTFFRQYGMGDFVSTGKSRYNIFKVVDANNNVLESTIKAEAHYTFYFSTEALNLMEAAGILTDVLDYDTLRAQVPASQKLLTEIANKKTTNVHITQYVNEYVSIETRIEVEKDFLNKQGSFEKHSEVLVKDTSGVVSSTEIESVSDTFIPKVEEQQEETVEEETKPTPKKRTHKPLTKSFGMLPQEDVVEDNNDEPCLEDNNVQDENFERDNEMSDEEKVMDIIRRIENGEINDGNRVQFKEEAKLLDKLRGLGSFTMLMQQAKRNRRKPRLEDNDDVTSIKRNGNYNTAPAYEEVEYVEEGSFPTDLDIDLFSNEELDIELDAM